MVWLVKVGYLPLMGRPSIFLMNLYTGMRFFRNFLDLRGHSRGNPGSGLIFIGEGGYHILCGVTIY